MTSVGDSGAGTLRQAIADLCPGGTITFAAGLASPITLTSGALLIDHSMTITGPIASALTIQRSTAAGTPDFRLFTVNGGQSLTLANLTLANGKATDGGAILNSGNLTINNCTLSANSCTLNGGAIASFGGSATITNSTISGNSAVIGGGGIYSEAFLVVTASTISNNTGPTGGGIRRGAGGTIVFNSIIAGNVGTNSDVFGIFSSSGHNLIGKRDGSTGFFIGSNNDIVGTNALPVDAKLGQLQDNGGPTFTHALLAGSPAIDAGDNCLLNRSCAINFLAFNLTTDQRGASRPANSIIDIGAFENFITVNPSALPRGAVGTSYSQTITASGGIAPYALNLGGALPAGLVSQLEQACCRERRPLVASST